MTVVDIGELSGVIIDITDEEVTIVGSSSVGPPGVKGASGSTGPSGPQGFTGPPGSIGGQRWYGMGPPGTIIGSQPNDEYVDVLTGDLYVLL